MAWDDSPPTDAELGSANAWSALPPTQQELAKAAPPEEPSMMQNLGHAAIDSLPLVGGTAGAAVGTATGFLGGLGVGAGPGAVAGAGLGYAGGKALKNAINSYVNPEAAPKTLKDSAIDTATGIPEGMAMEAGGQAVGEGLGALRNAPYIKPYLDKAGDLVVGGFNKLGKYVGDKAEQFAVAATGATGKQASEFAPGTGRALLDNGVVKFGRNQAKIADSAGALLDKTGEDIGQTVGEISAKDSVTKSQLLAERNRLQSLIANDPANKLAAQASTPRQQSLPGQINDLQSTIQNPVQVEINGANAQSMSPQPAPPLQSQPYLPDLPTGESESNRMLQASNDPFGMAHGSHIGETMAPQAQRDFLNQNSAEQMSMFGHQGEINGTGLTPRSYASGEVPGIAGGHGQTEMQLDGGSGQSSYLDQLKYQLADVNGRLMTGSREAILKDVDSQIASLGDDVSQTGTINRLRDIRDDIASGPEYPSMNLIEKTKRGFQEKVNWNSPDANPSNTAAADIYKNTGEKVAQNTDPALAQKFMDQKTLYGQMAPAANAAERRAATTANSPPLGLLDTTAFLAGGPQAVIGRRVIAPRINSSMASTANGLSQALKATPAAFGKWAQPLAAAAARGETALNAADYVLQQTQPEYRQKRQDMDSPGAMSPLSEAEN